MINGLYKITSPSGSVYIGQSRDIKRRKRQHNRKSHSNEYLKRSIDKYGWENHIFEILHELPNDADKKVVDDYEILYIKFYRDAGIRLMNLREGGVGGGKMSQETIDKCTLSKIGRKMHPNTKSAIIAACKGRKASDKVIAAFDKFRTLENSRKYGLLNKGKVRTEENKKRISDTLKSRTDNKGEHHHLSKLTNEIVLEIRRKYIRNVYSTSMLAKEYNVSKTNIKDIINRKIWRHI